MKDNKLYKVLRIIFLTLAILSMVFSLSKKFVHAEGSSTSSLPLPFGFGSGYGYREWTGQNPIPYLVQYCVDNNIPCYGMLMYEQANDNSYVVVTVCKEDFYYSMRNNSGTIPTYPPIYLLDISGSSVIDAIRLKIELDGSISVYQSDFQLSGATLYLNGSNVVSSGVAFLNYPLYYQDYGDISCFSDNGVGWYTGFAFSGLTPAPEPALGQGSIIGEVTDYDGRGFDYDLNISIDLNPLQVLGEEIRDGIGTLKDRVVEGFQVIGGKIDSFKDRVVEGFQTLTSIPSKVSDIYDYITDPFDEEKFSEKFEEMELGQELTTFRTDIESFTGTFNVAPAAAEDVRFSIPFTLPYVNQNLQAVIDFSFYDRIRSIVVPFFTVFLIFGMVWSLIRSIPGILHGTSPDGDS